MTPSTRELHEQIVQLTNLRFDHLHAEIEALRVLKEHDLTAIETRFRENKESLQAAVVAANLTIQRAADAVDRRFESVNEFRQALQDQAGAFMTRAEADAKFRSLEENMRPLTSSIEKLRDQAAASGGRTTGIGIMFAGLMGILAILVSLGSVIFAHPASDKRFDDVQARLDAQSARLNLLSVSPLSVVPSPPRR